MRACHTGVRLESLTYGRGMTLIELLVVISIMLLLAVVAIPTIRPALSTRETRDSARSIDVYLGAARNRAIETGRPVGVEIVRDPNQTLVGTMLYQLEVPPPYAGDSFGAVIRVINATPVAGLTGTVLRAQVRGDPAGTIGATQLSPGLLRWGDLIQLNNQGPLYRIVDDPNDNTPAGASYGSSPPATSVGADFPLNPTNLATGFIDLLSVGKDTDGDGWIDDHWLTLVAQDGQTYNVPWSTAWATSQPVTFTVYRQPVRSSIAPLRLPSSMAIDLNYSGSGVGSSYTYFWPLSDPDPTPNIITFSPNGGVDRVYGPNFNGYRVLNPIYLLVGKRARVPTSLTSGTNPLGSGEPIAEQTPTDSGRNLDDLTSLWVAINPTTGLVICAETNPIAAADWPPFPTLGDPRYPNDLFRGQRATGDAVIFARQMQGMGGR